MGIFLMLDPMYWLLMGPALVLSLIAQGLMSGAFSKYGKKALRSGYSGAEAAMKILRTFGLNDVSVEMTRGMLSDHYDPRTRTLRLSQQVYSGRSVSSVGVAAHEAGHAIQHAKGYLPLKARNLIVPVASIGSWLAFPMILIGLFIGYLGLIKVGIVLFSALVVFQLITLPVEINASTRAKRILSESGIVATVDEEKGVRRVLNAAALTYVAATATAILQLLYFLLLAGVLGGDE